MRDVRSPTWESRFPRAVCCSALGEHDRKAHNKNTNLYDSKRYHEARRPLPDSLSRLRLVVIRYPASWFVAQFPPLSLFAWRKPEWTLRQRAKVNVASASAYTKLPTGASQLTCPVAGHAKNEVPDLFDASEHCQASSMGLHIPGGQQESPKSSIPTSSRLVLTALAPRVFACERGASGYPAHGATTGCWSAEGASRH